MHQNTERGHKSKETSKGIFKIQYERFYNFHQEWKEEYFKDRDGEDLEFYSKKHADDWIEARIGINNAII